MRLKVDLDSVTLLINTQPVEQDSSGKPLLPDTWFVLNLPRGDYEVRFQREGYDPIEARISVQPRKVSAFEARFRNASEDSVKPTTGSATLNLLSDPEGAKIVVEMLADTVIAPETLNASTGDHSFKAMAEGCEVLTHTMTVEPDKIISLNFILAFTQPTDLTAEDLNLEYKPVVPLMDEAEAKKQKEMFNNLAETFALIPLGQGILARVLLGDETDTGANILIATGASLTATAFILGKIIPKRKLDKIRAYNEEANRINSEAKYYNQEIENKIEARNSELLENWMLQNEDRGKVEINVE